MMTPMSLHRAPLHPRLSAHPSAVVHMFHSEGHVLSGMSWLAGSSRADGGVHAAAGHELQPQVGGWVGPLMLQPQVSG